MTADSYSPTTEPANEVKMAHIMNSTETNGNNKNANIVLEVEEQHFLCRCFKIRHADKIVNCLGEFFGSATLLFLTCMACVEGLGEPLNLLQIHLACGLSVLVALSIFGGITHCHINPSLTLASVICRIISVPMAIFYVIFQLAGALVGIGLLRIVSPSHTYLQSNSTLGLCMTMPNNQLTPIQAMFTEAVLTIVLIWLTCAVWDERNSRWEGLVPIKFGLTVTLLIFVGGPFTGASMNPVRSLAPAIFAGNMNSQWIYTAGPLMGSFFAAVTYQLMFSVRN